MHTKRVLFARTGLVAALLFALASCTTAPRQPETPVAESRNFSLTHAPAPAAGELVISFINVGQGDCTLVEFPNGKRLLVDCGSTDGPFDADRVRTAIRSRLNSADPRIDLLVITHPDADHYNKLVQVLGPSGSPLIRVEKILHVGTPAEHNEAGTTAWLNSFPSSRRTAITDQSYNVAPARPLPGLEDSGAVILAANVTATASAKNARSIVVKVTHGTFDAMITGDATSATDRRILDLYPGASRTFLDVEVWKAAHHGSWATATQSATWANAAKPEAVIYSCSSTNGYGHPNIRLAQTFAPHTQAAADHSVSFFTGMNAPATAAQNQPFRTEAMYSTSTNGTIVVRSNGTTWATTLERN